ncbi:hypothetical protein VCHC62A1_0523A, partial [Vibrio cholerae HC-62A1]
MLSQHNDEE